MATPIILIIAWLSLIAVGAVVAERYLRARGKALAKARAHLDDSIGRHQESRRLLAEARAHLASAHRSRHDAERALAEARAHLDTCRALAERATT